jgi:predicted dehydrogenase
MSDFRVAVVGAGKMGKLHARVLSEMENAALACVVDASPAAAAALGKQRDVRALTDAAEAVELADAAIIAVPTAHHFEAARPFIEAGKAVLIEKPLCNDPEVGRELLALAEKHGASVQVGHTERFNPAFVAVQAHAIEPKFIEAHRISPFTFRSADVGVVLDMMIHDLDLVGLLAGGKPQSVHAVGVNVIGAHEDICNARVVFDNGCVANLTASRLAIKTERKMRVFSEQAYLSVDYGKKVGLMVRKDANVDLIQMAREMDAADLAELAGSMDYTKLLHVEELDVMETSEPLRSQAEAFRRTVVEGAEPVVSAQQGLAAVQLAHDIVESIRHHRWDGQAGQREGLDILRK